MIEKTATTPTVAINWPIKLGFIDLHFVVPNFFALTRRI